MKLVFLGTASCFPTASRGVSCTALQLDDGQVWIFDCGEGSQIQIQKSCIKPGKISKIFITHLHGDHLFGLPGLLCSMGAGLEPEKAKETVVEIYGPKGLRKFVHTTLGLSRSGLAFKIVIFELVPRSDMYPPDWGQLGVEHELPSAEKLPVEVGHTNIETSDSSWKLFSDGQYSVSAAALKHRIPSFGFVISESSSPGPLDSKKLAEKGVKPGPIYGQLKKGESVKLESGEILNPLDYLGPDIPGRKVAILGDTCDSSEMIPISEDLDVLVHEATNENSLKETCVANGHSTPDMAAQVAVDCNARSLLLFHVSQRYKPVDLTLSEEKSEETTGDANILETEAKEYLKNSGRPDIDVVVAYDFYEFVIMKKK
eukprot:GFUD01010861.1.p1 GENE.GFUD01010861.1~~GFUD01010861.1.p1  ORF type:complete len:372 (+),score=92.96 GFUD01010861.1:251-1366(+)